MGNHRVLWDLRGPTRVRRQDPRSLATNGVAVTNALLAFRMFFLNNQAALMAQIVFPKAQVSAVEVDVQTTLPMLLRLSRLDLQRHCYHDQTNLHDKTLSHLLVLISLPTAPPVVLTPLTMEMKTLIGAAVAGAKVQREARRGDLPDTGRVVRTAVTAILLQAIFRLQVSHRVHAIMIGPIVEGKSSLVSIEAGVEWVLVRVPGRLQLTSVGERRAVVGEIAIWVLKTGIGGARATG